METFTSLPNTYTTGQELFSCIFGLTQNQQDIYVKHHSNTKVIWGQSHKMVNNELKIKCKRGKLILSQKQQCYLSLVPTTTQAPLLKGQNSLVASG